MSCFMTRGCVADIVADFHQTKGLEKKASGACEWCITRESVGSATITNSHAVNVISAKGKH